MNKDGIRRSERTWKWWVVTGVQVIYLDSQDEEKEVVVERKRPKLGLGRGCTHLGVLWPVCCGKQS